MYCCNLWNEYLLAIHFNSDILHSLAIRANGGREHTQHFLQNNTFPVVVMQFDSEGIPS